MTLDLFLVCVVVGSLAGVAVELLSAPGERAALQLDVESMRERASCAPVRRPAPRRRARSSL